MKLRLIRAPLPQPTQSDRTDLRWIHAAQLSQPEAFQSLTDVETDFVHDVGCPADVPCHVHIPGPERVLASRADDINLSAEACYVVSLVLETPAEAVDYLYDAFTERITRARLLRYLRRQLGWPPARTRNVFYELADYVEGWGE